MEHEVGSVDGLAAGVEIPEVAVYEMEPAPGLFTYPLADVVEVGAVARRKVVESTDSLSGAEERLRKVGPDEPGRPGHAPRTHLGADPVGCSIESHQQQTG